MKELGKVIRAKIFDEGYTLRQFCIKVGMNEKSLTYKIRNGSFTFVEMLKIMEILDLSLDEIKRIINYEPVQL